MNERNVLHTVGLLLLIALFLPSPAAWAQSGGGYELEWSTVDGGGAVSTGGEYALGGTAGQPDAGVFSGGGYVLSGGFWQIKVENPTVARVVALVAQAPAWSGIAAAAVLLAALVWSKSRFSSET